MTATKFWACFLIMTANAIRSRYGIDFGLDDQMANDIIGYLATAAVWTFPNKPVQK